MALSYVIYQYAPENRKDTLTDIVSRDFIYKVLLPPIVLAEGFNLRKSTFGKFGEEVISIGIVVPILAVLAITCTLYSVVSISEFLPSFAKDFHLE